MRTAVIATSCFLLGLVAGMGAISSASDIRFEAMGGTCQHRLAQDASWSYREWGNYETNMNIKPACYQLGVSWMPKWGGETRLGLRISYVDLGKITADNTFPQDEKAYFQAKESGTPVNSTTSRFQGHGGTRGITYGLASEFPVGPLQVGPEAGAAWLFSRWKAFFPDKEEERSGCGIGWSCADGWHATMYVGATVRYEWLMFSYRRYFNAHASKASENPLFIGPTTGPVDQFVVGLSIPFK